MDPQKLSNHVIEAAETQEGTWTVKFLNEISDTCRQFSQKQVDSFVHLLMTDTKWDTMDNSAKLKIAQVLVSLRSFFFPTINISITKEKAAITHCASSVKSGKIADATRKVLNSLLTPAVGTMHSRPMPTTTRQRIHSMSVQPKERSIPITPPPEPEEHPQVTENNSINGFPKLFSNGL